MSESNTRRHPGVREPFPGTHCEPGLGLSNQHLRTLSYVLIFSQSLFCQSSIVKEGIASHVVKILADDLRMDQSSLVDCLGIARSTFSRKIKDKEVLSRADSERVLGVLKLVGQVAAMIGYSGNAKDFDASAWVGHWLESPLPALGNEPPAKFMDTGPGQELVSRLLAQAQSGAFA